MKMFRQFILATFALLLMQCEEVIHVDLDTVDPKLVIDASIDWEKGTAGNTQTIKITTTSGYYDTESPTVSGATVTVTTSSKDFVFSEGPETGQYTCTDFEPVIGESYTLTIGYNGQTYTASETLISTPDMEDQIDQINNGGFGGDEIEVKFYFQDDGSQNNFYMSSVQASFAKFPIYTVDSDERTQGNLTNLVFSHEDTAQGDILAIRLSGISERYFNYMTRLLEATGTGGGPFSTTPAAVRGNIVNQTNKANYALGYFRLSQRVTRNYTVQ
jgi:Domain of unknown function (DUF4249)